MTGSLATYRYCRSFGVENFKCYDWFLQRRRYKLCSDWLYPLICALSPHMLHCSRYMHVILIHHFPAQKRKCSESGLTINFWIGTTCFDLVRDEMLFGAWKIACSSRYPKETSDQSDGRSSKPVTLLQTRPEHSLLAVPTFWVFQNKGTTKYTLRSECVGKE